MVGVSRRGFPACVDCGSGLFTVDPLGCLPRFFEEAGARFYAKAFGGEEQKRAPEKVRRPGARGERRKGLRVPY